MPGPIAKDAEANNLGVRAVDEIVPNHFSPIAAREIDQSRE